MHQMFKKNGAHLKLFTRACSSAAVGCYGVRGQMHGVMQVGKEERRETWKIEILRKINKYQ